MTALILQGATTMQSDLAGARVFDSLTGVKQSLVHVHFPSNNGVHQGSQSYPVQMPIALMDSLWQQKQITLLSWGCWDLATGKAWLPADIVSGKHDAQLHQAAGLLAAWQHPLFIRLHCEMNGQWESWFWPPADYVRVWRYLVSLFRSDGATNVTWVWCPSMVSLPGSVSSLAADRLASWYPGDSYVDWTGFDAYDWWTAKGMRRLDFNQTIYGDHDSGYGNTYATVEAIAPTKPMLLSEFGTLADQTAWISDALRQIPTTLIRGISYFNVNDTSNAGALWALTGAAPAAWAWGIRNGPYAIPGMYAMPPDLTPILPLEVSTSWGPDPQALALEAAQATNAAYYAACETALDGMTALQALHAAADQ